MLPLDVQGELLISFQEERRLRRLAEASMPKRLTRRARFLRRSGSLLIQAGMALQRAAGTAVHSPAGRLGEVAG